MIDIDIGPRLLAARREAGLSVRALAAEIGVSGALISQIETGRTQPSVTTLYALVDRLGLSLDWLIGLTPVAPPTGEPQPEGPPVRRADAHPVLQIAAGVRWELISSPADGAAEAVLVTYDPGASSSPEGQPATHDGVESAYLIEGALTLLVDAESFDLVAGDSLVVDSRRPHRYENRSNAAARGIWMTTGTPHLS